MRTRNTFAIICCAALLVGCTTISTFEKLETGAMSEAHYMWQRWIEGNGDIAVATTWERKVRPGVTAKDVEEILKHVASERNMKEVGTLPLSKELEARTGQKQKFLQVYSFCSPSTARAMADFSPNMSAYFPCRITVLEKDDGLWLYTLNMDMMIKMGRKLPPNLREDAIHVRDSIHEMLERASRGEI